MSKKPRFRRTPEEIEAGLTVEQAKEARKKPAKPEPVEEVAKPEPTQEDLEAKHKDNPNIKVKVGLGDVVEKVTKATGIKSIVDWFTPEGEDCGCDERREKFNAKMSIIRNKSTVNCLTLEEYRTLSDLLPNNKQVNAAQVQKLIDIHSRVFNTKRYSDCNGCSLKYVFNELKEVLKTYE